MSVRNFDILPTPDWNANTEWRRQELYLFPDIGNYVVLRKDIAPSDVVGCIQLYGGIVGTDDKKLGRQISIRTGSTVEWFSIYRKLDHTWRVKGSYYWYKIKFLEVFDSEQAAQDCI